VPQLFTNLFSITKALQQGWKISNHCISEIKIIKGNIMIVFDHVIKTELGQILGVEMIPRGERANFMLDKGKVIDINKIHHILGHASEETTKRTAKYYRVELKGTMEKCESCALAKARQKNVSKVTEHKATKVGERIYMDISSVNTHTFGGNKYWLLVIDAFSDMCWSYFLPAKSNLSKQMLYLIKKLNNMQHVNVKFIRCDDAGENHTFQQQSILANLDLTFEFTGPGSPQYNGVVERKFATLYYGRVRSMLNAAQLSAEHRSGLWAEAAQTATDIENSLVSVNQPSYLIKCYIPKSLPPLKRCMHLVRLRLLKTIQNAKYAINLKIENVPASIWDVLLIIAPMLVAFYI
jgi:hypothetical protein